MALPLVVVTDRLRLELWDAPTVTAIRAGERRAGWHPSFPRAVPFGLRRAVPCAVPSSLARAVPFALRASTVAHVLTFALFVWFGELVGLGWLWWVGLALAAVAFGYQHVVVTPTDLSRVNRAFFTANGFVGIALFVFALLDLVLRLGLRA